MKYEKAIQCFNKVLDINPENILALYNKGNIYWVYVNWRNMKMKTERIILAFLTVINIVLIVTPLYSQDIFSAIRKGDIEQVRTLIEKKTIRNSTLDLWKVYNCLFL